MSDLIDALPGLEMPVAEVTERLAAMWEAGPTGSPSEFRASQMNVVLHFGKRVGEGEASARFQSLLRFSQRYPCRIIVLCPSRSGENGAMRSKLFSQCYIGESHREMCCCEALLLSYDPDDCGYLANQVSVWLEPDLPVFHWFSRVPVARMRQYLDSLLVGVRRCIYDSDLEPDEVESMEWPEPDRVVDLARARLLPVRQAVGQFLSGFPVERLWHGLRSVTLRHRNDLAGEGRRLMEWFRACFGECARIAGGSVEDVAFATEPLDDDQGDTALMVEWRYADERYFRWWKLADGVEGRIEARFGPREECVPTRIKQLSEEEALGEALFF